MGTVHLRVCDLDQALHVWRDLVGLTVLSRSPGLAELGAGGRPLIVLEGKATKPTPRHGLGLYHVALQVPTRRDFARAAARLSSARWPYSPVDHLANEAIYLSDVDGNGIELMFETPERGHVDVVDGRFCFVPADGYLRPARETLDVTGLFAELTGTEPLRTPLPAGTCVGHVHLCVADLERALTFYADVIGFTPNRKGTAVGMYDTALGPNSHAVAFNNWASRRARSAQPNAAGLESFTVEVPSAAIIGEAAGRLDAAGIDAVVNVGSLITRDPWGNRLRLVAPE